MQPKWQVLSGDSITYLIMYMMSKVLSGDSTRASEVRHAMLELVVLAKPQDALRATGNNKHRMLCGKGCENGGV